jgi:hypothetical protein
VTTPRYAGRIKAHSSEPTVRSTATAMTISPGTSHSEPADRVHNAGAPPPAGSARIRAATLPEVARYRTNICRPETGHPQASFVRHTSAKKQGGSTRPGALRQGVPLTDRSPPHVMVIKMPRCLLRCRPWVMGFIWSQVPCAWPAATGSSAAGENRVVSSSAVMPQFRHVSAASLRHKTCSTILRAAALNCWWVVSAEPYGTVPDHY